MERLREDYPIVNLEDRLPSPGRSVLPTPPMDPEYASQIDTFAENVRRRNSGYYLLHSQEVQRFVSNPGFGAARMIDSRFGRLEPAPRRTPIPQAELQLTSQSNWDLEHPYQPVTADIKKYHGEAVLHFTFPEAWGYFDTRAKVYGFQPHQIGTRNDSLLGKEMPPSPGNWEVRTVELIGLVLHSEPTVYMTANMPTMEEAVKAPRRPPDEFEAAGLKAIAAGEPIYLGLARKERVLRMVGPIAATPSCVKCHECQEGELLGAMSYVLKTPGSYTAIKP